MRRWNVTSRRVSVGLIIGLISIIGVSVGVVVASAGNAGPAKQHVHMTSFQRSSGQGR